MGGVVLALSIAFGRGDVGHVRALVEVAACGVVGVAVFGVIQAALRAPELGWLKSSIVGRRRATAGSA
jgi:hypothetical protein